MYRYSRCRRARTNSLHVNDFHEIRHGFVVHLVTSLFSPSLNNTHLTDLVIDEIFLKSRNWIYHVNHQIGMGNPVMIETRTKPGARISQFPRKDQ